MSHHHRSVVVADDPLTFSEAEDINHEITNRAGVGCQQVEVVNAANWHTPVRGRFCGRLRKDVSFPADAVT